MLELSRGYVAYLLAGYGEPEVSAAILKSSDAEFRGVQEAGNQAATQGKEWLKVACRTAVEIMEGRSRELRRRQLSTSDVPQELMAADNKAYAKRAERFLDVNADLKLTRFDDNRRSKIDPPWAPFGIKLMPFSWPSDRLSVCL